MPYERSHGILRTLENLCMPAEGMYYTSDVAIVPVSEYAMLPRSRAGTHILEGATKEPPL